MHAEAAPEARSSALGARRRERTEVTAWLPVGACSDHSGAPRAWVSPRVGRPCRRASSLEGWTERLVPELPAQARPSSVGRHRVPQEAWPGPAQALRVEAIRRERREAPLATALALPAGGSWRARLRCRVQADVWALPEAVSSAAERPWEDRPVRRLLALEHASAAEWSQRASEVRALRPGHRVLARAASPEHPGEPLREGLLEHSKAQTRPERWQRAAVEEARVRRQAAPEQGGASVALALSPGSAVPWPEGREGSSLERRREQLPRVRVRRQGLEAGERRAGAEEPALLARASAGHLEAWALGPCRKGPVARRAASAVRQAALRAWEGACPAEREGPVLA
jgi:hypothetical protein